MSTLKRLAPWLAALLLAIAALWLYVSYEQSRVSRQEGVLAAGIILLPQARPLPDLRFTSDRNQPFASEDFAGSWSLVFMGYTFCPDICPTTLAELREIHSQLPADIRQQLRVFMVTVDPQRDTPERLHSYLEFFNPEFIGLHGNLDDIQSLSATLGIPFIPARTDTENYTVDHSGNLAILGPKGELRGFVRAPLQVQRLAEQLPLLMQP